MKFDPIQFINSLKYMGVGMLGILIVMAVIMATIWGLSFLGSLGKKNDEENK